ncbi:MAG: hypothetical protein M3Z20_04590 [Chloroflexota bacterium]|nr:hypothetical protein [Chloroflexota bacterium]
MLAIITKSSTPSSPSLAFSRRVAVGHQETQSQSLTHLPRSATRPSLWLAWRPVLAQEATRFGAKADKGDAIRKGTGCHRRDCQSAPRDDLADPPHGEATHQESQQQHEDTQINNQLHHWRIS